MIDRLYESADNAADAAAAARVLAEATLADPTAAPRDLENAREILAADTATLETALTPAASSSDNKPDDATAATNPRWHVDDVQHLVQQALPPTATPEQTTEVLTDLLTILNAWSTNLPTPLDERHLPPLVVYLFQVRNTATPGNHTVEPVETGRHVRPRHQHNEPSSVSELITRTDTRAAQRLPASQLFPATTATRPAAAAASETPWKRDRSTP